MTGRAALSVRFSPFSIAEPERSTLVPVTSLRGENARSWKYCSFSERFMQTRNETSMLAPSLMFSRVFHECAQSSFIDAEAKR